ncbi:MAG: 3-oxoacyl-[acyl-carrier-protein] reductase [Atopococcus tabaci]|uniref:3-oxoacyl-[acyl-carrier-protein] reductase n=1 Tax=Atopococcus tabaci TaxID=269774 RepID=A0AA43UBX5_9LACT|nr:3-oxoacyl-[acyl-carrier-protein] reductase [Atopococcus tabaci]
MAEIALITGSVKGIGLGIAKYLAKKGYKVILNHYKEVSQELLDEFKDAFEEVDYVIGDVSDFDQAKAMVDEVVAKYGRLDILVNNAGITRDALAMRMKEAEFDDVINVNLKGSFNMMRHVTKPMLKQKAGTIINMSSLVGIVGNAGQVNYAASKAGVIGMTKSFARELGSRQITVNAIAPGYIETDMTDILSDKIKKQMLDTIPMKKFGNVEDIAKTVEFLIESEYITGQVIEVNGGMNM